MGQLSTIQIPTYLTNTTKYCVIIILILITLTISIKCICSIINTIRECAHTDFSWLDEDDDEDDDDWNDWDEDDEDNDEEDNF